MKAVLIFSPLCLFVVLTTLTAQTGDYLHFLPESDCSDGQLIALMQRQLNGESGLEADIETARKKLEDCGGMGQASSEEESEAEAEEESESEVSEDNFVATRHSEFESETNYTDESPPADSKKNRKTDFSNDYHAISPKSKGNKISWLLGKSCTTRTCKTWSKIPQALIDENELAYNSKGNNKWIMYKSIYFGQYKTTNVFGHENNEASRSRLTGSIFNANLRGSNYTYNSLQKNRNNIDLAKISIVVSTNHGLTVLGGSKGRRDFKELKGLFKESQHDSFAQHVSILLVLITELNLKYKVNYFNAIKRQAVFWIDEGSESMPILLEKGSYTQVFKKLKSNIHSYKFYRDNIYTETNFDQLKDFAN